LILLLTVHLDLFLGDGAETEFEEEKYPVILRMSERSTVIHRPSGARLAGIRSSWCERSWVQRSSWQRTLALQRLRQASCLVFTGVTVFQEVDNHRAEDVVHGKRSTSS
jgi:hypothetical protein